MGKYCASCGQKDQPVPPDFHHFFHDVAHEFLHLDGKIVHSLKMLLFRPGLLTNEYWEGHRAAQVPPLRLYLVASVVMFGLILLLPNVTRVPFEPTMKVTSTDYDNGAPHNIIELPVERRKEIVGQLFSPDSRWLLFRDPLIKAVEDPKEFRHRLLGNASKTMFVMLPLFALVTWLTFRRARRVYMEHLVLALHIHSIVFLLFAACAVISSEGQSAFRFAGDLLLLTGLPFYSVTTFKSVFRLSWFSTLMRAAVTGVLYLSVFVVIEVALVAATLSTF
jgi:hypothetical protein